MSFIYFFSARCAPTLPEKFCVVLNRDSLIRGDLRCMSFLHIPGLHFSIEFIESMPNRWRLRESKDGNYAWEEDRAKSEAKTCCEIRRRKRKSIFLSLVDT